VIGGGLLSFIQLPGSTWKRIAFSLCLMAIAYLSFTFSHNMIIGCLALAILGFFLALANVLILTFFQSSADPEDVPVIMGMVNLISVASLPVSMGIVGAFIDNVSVPSFATICAAIVIAIAMSIRFIPGIRTI
jgi:predicted MFS family arabinose efflux permease